MTRRRWPYGVAGLVVLGIGGLWAHSALRAEAVAQIEARAARLGLTAQIGAVALRWPGELAIQNLELSGAGVALSLGAVRVEAGLDGLRPVPRAIEVAGVRGQIEPGALRRPSGGGGSGSGQGGATPVRLRDLAITVGAHGEVRAEALTGSTHELAGRLTLTTTDARLPPAITATIKARRSSVELVPEVPVAVEVGPVTVRVEGVHADTKGARATISAKLGSRAALTGATARWAPGALPAIEGGELTLRLPAEGGSTPSARGSAAGSLPPPLVARDLTVRVEGQPAWPPLHLDEARWTGAAATARGQLGAGTFDLYAGDWVGLRPSTLAAEFEAVPAEGWGAQVTARGQLIAAAEGPLGSTWPLAVVADVALSDGALNARWLGEPVEGLAGAARLGLRGEPGHMVLDHAVLSHGALVVRAQGEWVDDAEGGHLRLRAGVDPVDCQAALDAIPPSVLGPYSGLAATGTYQPTLRLDLPIGRPADVAIKARGWTRRCTFTELHSARGVSPRIKVGGRPADLSDVTWLAEPFVFEVLEGVDAGRTVRVGPGSGNYVALSRLPAYVGGAAYLTEEMNFWKGGAFSPGLLARAFATNLGTGRYTYGGSTITQQLVKNLVLDRRKTPLRKIREIMVAARVTDALPKARILELYLNCIEFGPNLFGVGRAARAYFQKDAAALTPREAIFLAMLKPAPRRGAWYKRRGHEPDFPWWRGRVVQVAGRLRDAGLINAAQYAEAIRGRLTWVDGQYVGVVEPEAPAAPE